MFKHWNNSAPSKQIEFYSLNLKLKFYFTLMIALVAVSALGQTNQLDIGKYKYRTDGFKALAFKPDLNFGSQNNNINGNGKNRSFSQNNFLFYKFQNSKDKSISNINMRFSGGHFSSLKNDTTFDRNSSIGYFLNGSQTYFNSKSQYVQLDLFSFLSPSVRNTNENFTVKEKYLNIQVNPTISIGKGRMENVSNAQLAAFILNDLEKAKKLKVKVSNDLLIELTEVITKVYNTRIFDYRKRRIYEVSQIDSFLMAKKAIAQNDIATFAIIQDNWDFAIQPSAVDAFYDYSNLLIATPYNSVSDRYNLKGILNQNDRFCGQRYFFSASVNLDNKNVRRQSDSVSNKDLNRNNNFSLGLNYEKAKPISLHWQVKGFINILYFNSHASSIERSGPKKNYNSQDVSTNLSGAIEYYPNSRTIVSVAPRIGYTKNLKNSLTSNTSTIASGLNIKSDYFINYNSRVTLQIDYSIIKNKYSPAFSSFDFRMGYNVYIF
jgi:hypothetical protein